MMVYMQLRSNILYRIRGLCLYDTSRVENLLNRYSKMGGFRQECTEMLRVIKQAMHLTWSSRF